MRDVFDGEMITEFLLKDAANSIFCETQEEREELISFLETFGYRRNTINSPTHMYVYLSDERDEYDGGIVICTDDSDLNSPCLKFEDVVIREDYEPEDLSVLYAW